MAYVALLRGINVGGKNTVEMKRLKATFERAGMKAVRTYINSGNVVFQHDSHDTGPLADALARAIEADFGFPVKVLVRDSRDFAVLMGALPDSWVNDQTAKCDVMFLREAVDHESVLDQLVIRPEIDDVRYVPGALLWRVDRPNATKSGMMKLVGTELYAQMTVRNCNTLRKLAALVQEADAT